MPRFGGAAPAQAAHLPLTIAEPDRRWDLLLMCLAAYVLTAVGRVHQLFAFLEPLHLILLSAGLAICIYCADGKRTRRLRTVLRYRTTRCVLAIALWMALSIPGALWPGGAFQTLTDEFGKIAVMYVVLVAAIRGFRDVERLAFTYLAAVATYAAVVLSRFGVGQAQWRLDALVYYDANDFATLAVMAVPLAVYFMVRPRPRWRRLSSAVALVLLVTAFVWAGSRGGFLALLAVGVFLLLRYRAIHVRWRVLTAALLAFVFAAAASDTYWEKMRTILKPKDDYNFTDQEGRIQVWKRGIGYMLQRPFLGVGAGNFPTAEGTISPVARASVLRGVKWSVSHNSYVQVGAELGVPGLLLFLAMLWSAFRTLRSVQHAPIPPQPGERSPPPAQLGQALAAALLAYMVGGFFLSLAYRDLLYVLLALAVGLGKATGAMLQPRPALLVPSTPSRLSPPPVRGVAWQR
jgi:probable O-glycosylation ligase (exosortase A-associated)